MKVIANTLTQPPPPPPVPISVDPHAELWKRLEALPIRADDKITVGVYLARAENEGMRGWLSASSNATLETWVYRFLCNQDGKP